MKNKKGKAWKVGVFGSGSGSPEGEKVYAIARSIGTELARNGCIVITGAGSGVPYEAARAAADRGSKTWGFAPEWNSKAFLATEPGKVHAKEKLYSKLFFADRLNRSAVLDVRRKYRNVASTAECDGAIILAGKWGTLNEFTNLVEFGKVVGVLTGLGGVADEIPGLWQKIKKQRTVARVVFGKDPIRLVKRVIAELNKA